MKLYHLQVSYRHSLTDLDLTRIRSMQTNRTRAAFDAFGSSKSSVCPSRLSMRSARITRLQPTSSRPIPWAKLSVSGEKDSGQNKPELVMLVHGVCIMQLLEEFLPCVLLLGLVDRLGIEVI